MGVKVLRNMLTAQRTHKKRGSDVRTCLQKDESRGGIGVSHGAATSTFLTDYTRLKMEETQWIQQVLMQLHSVGKGKR